MVIMENLEMWVVATIYHKSGGKEPSGKIDYQQNGGDQTMTCLESQAPLLTVLFGVCLRDRRFASPDHVYGKKEATKYRRIGLLRTILSENQFFVPFKGFLPDFSTISLC